MFSKKADMIPLKTKNKQQLQKNLKKYWKIWVYLKKNSDQGSEFKSASFQKMLNNHNTQITFALEYAPFVKRV